MATIEKISPSLPHTLQKINLRESEKIFDMRHIGGIHIPGALDPNFLRFLESEVLDSERMNLLRKAPENQGRATQNVFSLYVGPADKEKHPDISLEDLVVVNRLAQVYTNSIYNSMASRGSFAWIPMVNSVGIHKYPGEKGGISYHKNFESDTGVVGVFSVRGNARFSLAYSRQGEGEEPHIVEPGDLILMRATVNLLGHDYHEGPFHKLETLGEDRYSITLRYSNGNGKH